MPEPQQPRHRDAAVVAADGLPRGAARVVGDGHELVPGDHARRPHPEPAQFRGDGGQLTVLRPAALGHLGGHRQLDGEVTGEDHREPSAERDAAAAAGPAHGPRRGHQRLGDRDGQQGVGGQQEARCRVVDGEQVRDGEGRGDDGGEERRRLPSGPPGDEHPGDGDRGQQEPPGGGPPVVPGTDARAAQGPSDQGADLVVHREAQAHAALDLARAGEPGHQAAVGRVRLHHPRQGAQGQTAGQQEGQGPPVAPGGDEERGGAQRQGEPEAVGGAHQGHEGDGRGRAPGGPAVRGPAGAAAHPAQEPAGGREGAEGAPEVGHGARAVEERDPQTREEQPGDAEHRGREQGAPDPQGEQESESGEQGQVDAQRRRGGGGVGEGGDRGAQPADPARAGGGEEGGGGVALDLGDVDDLVPAEAGAGHQDELGRGEDGGGSRRPQECGARVHEVRHGATLRADGRAAGTARGRRPAGGGQAVARVPPGGSATRVPRPVRGGGLPRPTGVTRS